MIDLTNAAGTAKTLEAARSFLATDARRVVLGSFTLRRRGGNGGVVDFFGERFSLNVRGIPSPDAEEWAGIVGQVAAEAAGKTGKTTCVSVAAFDPAEYGVLAGLAFDAGADAVELNFGCPNMQEAGAFAPIFSYRPEMVAAALDSLDRGREVWAKVSPVFDDALFDALAAALRHPAVTGVVATNTLPQCLALDDDGAPVLSFGHGVGGMAGPALKPIALAQAARWVRAGFRVIGVGGIASGADLRDFEHVGVESAQANTVTYLEGPSALDRILRDRS